MRYYQDFIARKPDTKGTKDIKGTADIIVCAPDIITCEPVGLQFNRI